MRIECSFIQVRGIGEQRERRLWEDGVTSWRDGLDTSAVGPKTGDRLVDFAHSAGEHLRARNVRFFAEVLPPREHWRLLETFRERVTALDIETTGLDFDRDAVTTATFHRPGETVTLVRGDDLTRERIRGELQRSDLLVTFNGKQFDVPFLERSFGLDVDVPHVDLRFVCRRLGWSGGLKAVERELGFDRDLPAVDGREAIRLWHQYRAGDEAALDRLVRYNRADARTLLPVADRAVDGLDGEVFDPYVPD